MKTAAKQASGSKIEITVNATGRQSMSPPRAPGNRDKVSHLKDIMKQAARNTAVWLRQGSHSVCKACPSVLPSL